MDATCFSCGELFRAKNDDDVAGDGKCPVCEERSKRVALQVDLKIAELNRINPHRHDNPRAMLIKELLSKPDGTKINARDLGLI